MKELWNLGSFGSVLLIPVLLGLFHGLRTRVATAYTFVFGPKDVSLCSSGFSIAAISSGVFSVLLLVQLNSTPSLTWTLAGVGYVAALVVVVVFFVPILHYSRSPSLFHYLDDRFNSQSTRYGCAAVFLMGNYAYSILCLTLMSEIASYILPIEAWVVCILLGTIVTFPVLTGGLAANIDLNMLLLLLGGVPSLVSLAGISYAKMIPQLEEAAEQTFNFATEPWSASVWSVVPYGFLVSLHLLGASQPVYQHFAPSVTKRRARLSLMASLPSTVLVLAISVVTGILMSRSLSACLPTIIENPYKRLATVILSLWKDTAPIAGFIFAGICCLLLAPFATNLVSVSTVLWEELFIRHFAFQKDRRQVLILQVLVAVQAISLIAISAVLLALLPNIWQLIRLLLLLLGSSSAAPTALFMAAVFFPCSNWRGAILGLTVGLACTSGLGAGYLYYHPGGDPISSFNHCTPKNLTDGLIPNSSYFNDTQNETDVNTYFLWGNQSEAIDLINLVESSGERDLQATDSEDSSDNIPIIFQISYLFHPVIGFLLAILATILGSLASGGQDVYALDWNLVFWTCNDCTQKLRFQKAKMKRGERVRTPYVHSESFKYARQGPLPDTSYRNPRVEELNKGMTKLDDQVTKLHHFGST